MAGTKCKAWSSAPGPQDVAKGTASEKQITDQGSFLEIANSSWHRFLWLPSLPCTLRETINSFLISLLRWPHGRASNLWRVQMRSEGEACPMSSGSGNSSGWNSGRQSKHKTKQNGKPDPALQRSFQNMPDPCSFWTSKCSYLGWTKKISHFFPNFSKLCVTFIMKCHFN